MLHMKFQCYISGSAEDFIDFHHIRIWWTFGSCDPTHLYSLTLICINFHSNALIRFLMKSGANSEQNKF